MDESTPSYDQTQDPPKGIELTLTHDGMTVRSPRSRHRVSLVVLAVALVFICRAFLFVGGVTGMDRLLFAQFVGIWNVSLLALWPRRVTVRGDWLILDGVGTTRLRLDEIEDIRMWGTSFLVFELRGGRRYRMWVRSAFAHEGKRWLRSALLAAVDRARTKSAQRSALDESSRHALSELQRSAVQR